VRTHRQAPRGAILLLVVILMAVLALLAGGVLSYSSRSLREASLHRREAELSACAEAGRQYLLSRFRLFAPAAELTSLTADVDLASGGAEACADGTERCARSGHVGGETPVTGVRVIPNASIPAAVASRDLTNAVADPYGLSGGRPYQVVVQCRGSGGRSLEVEFGLTFGL
jgi:type II secretory pathway pseudopilin PulG